MEPPGAWGRCQDMNSRVIAAVAGVLFLTAAPVFAQTTPSPTPAPTATPSGWPTIPANIGNIVQGIVQRLAGDATAGYGVDPNHVRGTVTFFQRFNLQVRMPLNQYRAIRLHQGTIINPRGATLAPGQVVDVQGRSNADGSLDADVITLIH